MRDIENFRDVEIQNQYTHDDAATQQEEERDHSRIVIGATETLNRSTSSADAALQLVRHHLTMPQLALGENLGFLDPWWRLLRNLRQDPKGFAVVLGLAVTFLAIAVGEHATSLSSSFIIGDSMGIPTPDSCGFFRLCFYNDWRLTSVANSQILSMYKTVDEDALQAVNDYRGMVRGASLGRHTFLPNINYTVRDGADCPFSGNVCFDDNDAALSLDTGLIDSAVLGINTNSVLKWRRQMTCAPLVSNSSYMNNIDQNGSMDSFGSYVKFSYFENPVIFDHKNGFIHEDSIINSICNCHGSRPDYSFCACDLSGFPYDSW